MRARPTAALQGSSGSLGDLTKPVGEDIFEKPLAHLRKLSSACLLIVLSLWPAALVTAPVQVRLCADAEGRNSAAERQAGQSILRRFTRMNALSNVFLWRSDITLLLLIDTTKSPAKT